MGGKRVGVDCADGSVGGVMTRVLRGGGSGKNIGDLCFINYKKSLKTLCPTGAFVRGRYSGVGSTLVGDGRFIRDAPGSFKRGSVVYLSYRGKGAPRAVTTTGLNGRGKTTMVVLA